MNMKYSAIFNIDAHCLYLGRYIILYIYYIEKIMYIIFILLLDGKMDVIASYRYTLHPSYLCL